MEKINILFVNDEMVMGGVARILCTLLKLLDKDKYEIDFLVLHKHGELLSEIPTNINVIEGTKFFRTVDIPLRECNISNLFSKLRLLLYMKTGLIKKKIIKERKKMLNKRYDIEFSAKEGFCTIFNAFGDSLKKINWIQTDYKENNFSINHMSLIKDALKNIDTNIACSEQVKNSFEEVFDIKDVVVINNPIDDERIRQMSLKECKLTMDNKKINLITVSRFHPQKGLDRLIKAFSKYKDFYSLTIVGDGELKDSLVALAKELDAYDDINWTGILSNPYPLIKASDLFVLSSLYEGYPTITIETLISGTPILSTRVAGITNQINNENYGYIVENNLDAIINALDSLKHSKKALLDKKEQLKKYRYDNNEIIDTFDKYFKVEN